MPWPMTWIDALFLLLLGLAIGSFLNVCISRVPAGESVVRPRSHCRQCSTPIAVWHNVPLVSWIALRGRCAACKTPIPWRYPLVEAATAVLFLACWWRFGLTLQACGAAVLGCLLIALGTIDAETMLLPDRLTLPGIALGIVFSALRDRDRSGALVRAAFIAMASALAAAGLLLLVRWGYWLLTRRMGMGLGDVKLLAMIGAWLGPADTLLAFVVATGTGALFALGVLLLYRRGEGEVPATQLPLPFGSFLSLGALYSIFLGEGTVRWYLHLFL